MAKIVISGQVIEKLDKLANILYEDGYLGHGIDCRAYVDSILDHIYTLPELRPRKTKKPRHGQF